jgi:hypothetical protein
VANRVSLSRRWPGAAAIVFAGLLACAVPAVADAVHEGEHGTGLDPTGILPPGTWTDEQIAFARELVERTERELPAFADYSKLGERGFVNFGLDDGAREHWIHAGYLNDEHVLDPRYPETLIFRKLPDGGHVLEAGMFNTLPGTRMDSIPAEIAWLPNWHLHEDMCSDPDGRYAGRPVNGQCARGKVIDTMPMTHVWIVDNDCNHRFAGVGLGVICKEHGHTVGTVPSGTVVLTLPPRTKPSTSPPTTPPSTKPTSTAPPSTTAPSTTAPSKSEAPPATPVTAEPHYTG